MRTLTRMAERTMVMAMDTERNAEAGTDPTNNPLPADFQPNLTGQKCFVWSTSKRVAVSDEKTLLIEDLKAMVPLGADVLEGDEITEVRNADGSVFLADRVKIEAPQTKQSHVLLSLEAIT